MPTNGKGGMVSSGTASRLRTQPKSFTQKMHEKIQQNLAPELKELTALEKEERERQRRVERLRMEAAALDAEVEAGYEP